MTHTVIGIFDDDSQAQQAVSRLVAAGLERQYIDISLKHEHGGRGDVTDENSTLGHKLGNYFRNIFADPDEALNYAAVAQRGAIVIAQTEGYAQAEMAADILDVFGAVDVNERARILEDGLTREDRTSRASSADTSTTRLSDLRSRDRDTSAVPVGSGRSHVVKPEDRTHHCHIIEQANGEFKV